ncbi:MAG TPA: nitroreductase family protein [Acidimicrobiia bacterium]
MSALPAFLEARRSIRAFLPGPVPRVDLDAFVTAACIAPAPHHSRPWRWVVLDTEPARRELAIAMGAHWRVDLERDGVGTARIDELVGASVERLSVAPAALLGCLTEDGLDRYPDDARRRAE